MNPAGTSAPGTPAVAPAVQDLLQRLLQLAREAELFVDNQSGESIYIDYRQGSWTRSMVEQFRREIEPYPEAQGLLRFAAEHAGTEVNYRDFLEGSSRTDTQVRSELGAISKVARKLFGNKVWPVRTRQGSDGIMRYCMPEGIADWWAEVDSASGQGTRTASPA